MLEKVEEAKKLIVGKFYLVPCISVNAKHNCFNEGEYVPILGNLHNDPEIGTNVFHYHYDRRFIKNPPPVGLIVGFAINNPACEIKFSPIEYCRRKCQRNSLNFPPALTHILEPMYQNCRLKNGYCPHREAFIGNIPPDEKGNVVCPAHGLKWNKKKGHLVNRN